MAHVVVTIAGRTYRMACDDGEEAHLEELARNLEAKILFLRDRFEEIGEQRVVVMAALTVADEASALEKKLAEAEAELASLRARDREAREQDAALRDCVTAALETAAERIERVAKNLARTDGDQGGGLQPDDTVSG